MANTPGMYQLADLMEVRNASAIEFGLDNIYATIQMEVAYAEQRMSEMRADLCQDFYVPSHSKPGITAHFPLVLKKQALGWNAEYFRRVKVNELAGKFLEARKGYFAAQVKGMRRAFYGFGNGTTSEYSFIDRLTNGVTLTIKSLCNGGVTVGDIPDSPAGVAFANTHCHLNFDDTVDASAYQDAIDHVVEHGNTKGLKCYIARANLAELATLTTIFTPYDSALIAAIERNTLKAMDWTDYENMEVGFLRGDIPVYVKPWAVAEYIGIVATGMPEKLLGYRQPADAALRGWRLQAQFEDHPLHAEYASAEFGYGVFNRVMGAISQDAASWTVPGPAI